jgi:hypothetical protein
MNVNSNPKVCQKNMKKYPGSKFSSFIVGVIETNDQPLLSTISTNFRENSKLP